MYITKRPSRRLTKVSSLRVRPHVTVDRLVKIRFIVTKLIYKLLISLLYCKIASIYLFGSDLFRGVIYKFPLFNYRLFKFFRL